jgi:tetratricopeptide (TPR) repeat protein
LTPTGELEQNEAGTMPKKQMVRKKLTRQEQKELDIEIGFMEGVIHRDPAYIEALQILGDDYTRRGRFIEGLTVDQRLAELRPREPLVYYNLACSFSLTKQFERGIDALERALTLGYRDFKWMAKDPDLANLRKHPLYKNIRGRIRAMQIKIH